MGLFTKATEKSKQNNAPSTGSKKGTKWVTGDPDGDAVAKAIHEMVKIAAEEKALKGKKSMHETILKKEALRRFIEHIAEVGVSPDTPMHLMNTDGEKVSYIVQDRSGQYKVKPEQKEALEQILGAEATEDLLYEQISFSFNREAMMKPGVAEAVEKALEAVDKKLRASGKLSDEDVLVDADVKEAFKPGTIDRVGIICGSDTTKIRNFLEAAGPNCTRYIKP